jgi:hypothetical protein
VVGVFVLALVLALVLAKLAKLAKLAVAFVAADPKEHKAIDIPARDYNRPTTAGRMNVRPFVSVHYDIQAKPVEFPAFGLLLRDSEFRTNYSRYARVKHQRIG